eukprot:546759_1
MQSESNYVWCQNIGCALITIQNQNIDIMAELEPKSSSIYDFYTTLFYKNIEASFSDIGICFLKISDIINGPPSNLLATKIYCACEPFTDNRKCYIQFPIFLLYFDIEKLHKINLYKKLPSYSIWIQYYYFNMGQLGYKICDKLSYLKWFEIINLSEWTLQIRNLSGNRNVIKPKVKTVAITELNKNQSYEYIIKQMTKYFDLHETYLIISFEIHKSCHNTKQKHFETICNEINRHILNNINDRNNKYKVLVLYNNNIKSIDYETEMNDKIKWNLPNNWINNHITNRNNKYNTNNNKWIELI